MASVADNNLHWGNTYDWPLAGDEWSGAWGDAQTQWRSTLLPRIWPFVPASSILEIAPGHGRWTQFLIGMSEKFVGVDLAESCTQKCKDRFTGSHAEFFTNDGRSLDMVANKSVDLIFSFDSLVHVEQEDIAGYIQEFSRILSDDGIAVIHHSNLAEYAGELAMAKGLSTVVAPIDLARKGLRKIGLTDWDLSRAPSMSAGRWVELCDDAGLACVGQEIINWRTARLTDCISIVARRGSKWDRKNVIVRNKDFVAEARSSKGLASVFTSLGVG